MSPSHALGRDAGALSALDISSLASTHAQGSRSLVRRARLSARDGPST